MALTPSTTYHYRVLARNSGGDSAYSSVVNATTWEPIPTLVSPLAYNNVTGTSVDLNIAQAATNATSYTIQRSTNGTTWADVYTGASRTYTDTNLAPATQYYYRYRASNRSGDSDWSATINFTTLPSAPGIPTGLTATPVGPNQVDVSWNQVNGATQYVLEMSTNGTTNWTEIYVGAETAFEHT